MEKFPEIFLGKTTERQSEPKSYPDAEVIFSPLESPNSVAREFCTSCGMLAEVNAAFLAENNIEKDALQTGDYLETDSCPDCPDQKNDTARTLRIRNIKEFTS